MAMEMDLFIGSWVTLKTYSTFTAPSIISILILVALLINYIIFGIIVAKEFLSNYLPKTKLNVEEIKLPSTENAKPT